MDTLDMSTSLAFRTLIKQKGMSHKDIANQMSFDESVISRIINFRRVLSFAEVYQFCKILEIDISEFIELVKKFSEDPDSLDNIRNLQKSLQKSRKAVSDLIDSFE